MDAKDKAATSPEWREKNDIDSDNPPTYHHKDDLL
jgi:hypothetical protein